MCFDKNDLVIESLNTEDEENKKENNSSYDDSSDATSELTESVKNDMLSGDEQRSQGA